MYLSGRGRVITRETLEIDLSLGRTATKVLNENVSYNASILSARLFYFPRLKVDSYLKRALVDLRHSSRSQRGNVRALSVHVSYRLVRGEIRLVWTVIACISIENDPRPRTLLSFERIRGINYFVPESRCCQQRSRQFSKLCPARLMRISIVSTFALPQQVLVLVLGWSLSMFLFVRHETLSSLDMWGTLSSYYLVRGKAKF